MYGRLGLHPIACHDLTDKGGCVVAQIVETVTEMKKVKVSGSQKRGTDIRPREQVPRHTREQVEKIMDDVFAELYPGDPMPENDVDEDNGIVPTRAPPYQHEGWRES